ncbi:MAG: 30S ribosomal protein S18, partial [Bdellovibrionales bacterium]|nr:30S ribosomal protein S18 [Bdellovibrionales bacterium]
NYTYMKKKLFVSNLDFDVTEEQLMEAFQEVAEPVSLTLAVDRESRRSKGFAFVEMPSEELAKQAIEALNEKELNGRPIRVCADRGKGGGAPGASASGPREDGDGGRRPREYLPPIQRMQLFRKKRKLDPFLSDPTKTVDYRDIATLGRFVSDRGKILSRRMTGLSAYNQRKVAKAIKRAQSLGLMGYRY